MTRAEHLQWCKNRALEYCDQGDLKNAMGSMSVDLQKHEETANHSAIELGFILQTGGHLSTKESMRKFIEGFN